MPIVIEGVSMKEFIYRKYVDSILNIIEEDPDLEFLEKDLSSVKVFDGTRDLEVSLILPPQKKRFYFSTNVT
jgi:hypothetical protein